MRYVIIAFLVIVLAVQGVLLMLFTATGNNMLLPYVNSYLQENVKDHKVEVSQFSLGLHTLSFKAKVNESIGLVSQGKVDLLAQTFDMDYVLDAKELRTAAIILKEDLSVKGNVKGHKEDMYITGKGVAFESYVSYELRRVDEELQDIKISMKKAQISKVLALFNKKPYAEGLLTLDVNMLQYNPQNPQGDAKVFIQQMTLDAEKISQDFDIDLPAKTLLSADIIASTKEDLIALEGSMQSNVLNLKLSNGIYDPRSKDFEVRYHLDTDDLSKFSTLAKRELRGVFALAGSASQTDGSLKVLGETRSFGGESKVVYLDDQMDLKLKNVDAKMLLYKLGEKAYLSGRTIAHINLESLKKGTGTFDLQVNGKVNTKVVKQKTKTNLGETFDINARAKGRMQDKKIYSQINMLTTMATIKAEKFTYDLKKKTLYTDYSMNIPDMRKLKPLIKRKLTGDMYLSGEIRKNKDLEIIGNGKEFDGSIDFRLFNDQLDANLTGATASKVMFMLGYPQVIEAITQAKVDYDTKKRKGVINGTLDNARLLPSELTILLEQFAKMKLTHERFNNSKFTVKIDNEIIYFSLDATNDRNYIKVTDGVLDKRTDMIKALVDVEMEGKDVAVTVKGTLDNPQVALDSSKYLQKKINKNIDKLIDKNIKGENAEQLKNLLKGFF